MNRSNNISRILRSGFFVTSIFLLAFVTLTFAAVDTQKMTTPDQVGKDTKTASLSPARVQRQAVLDTYGKLPLFFIENRGQLDQSVSFYVNQPRQSLYFTNQAIHLRLTQKEDKETKSHGLRVELVNADPKGNIKSISRASGIVSIFKGKKEQWKTNIPTSDEIAYTQPWPGISIHYKGNHGKIESIYHISPGATHH